MTKSLEYTLVFSVFVAGAYIAFDGMAMLQSPSFSLADVAHIFTGMYALTGACHFYRLVRKR